MIEEDDGCESIASLLEQVTRYRLALAPFAAFAGGFQVRRDDYCIASTALGNLTVGDLRRAKKALEASH